MSENFWWYNLYLWCEWLGVWQARFCGRGNCEFGDIRNVGVVAMVID